jgi:glycosyltransferase involved in cell wall biosynthesis
VISIVSDDSVAMLISIIIPTYNREDFIGVAISSVLNQTHEDFELIIVDNGSTDNTRELVGAHHDARVRYFYTENNERSAARNYGFDQSSGQLICFLDSDEEVSSDYLKCFAMAADNNPEVNVFRSRFEFHSVHGEMHTSTHREEEHDVIKVWKHFAPVSTYCMRRVICDINKWPEEFWIWEDRHYFLRIALQEKILELPCVTSIFRDHPGRSVHEVDPDKYLKKIEQTPLAIRDLWSTHGDKLSNWIRNADINRWNHESLRGVAIDAIEADQPDLARIALVRALKYTSVSLWPRWLYTYLRTIFPGFKLR